MLRAVAVLLERRPELRSSLTVAVVGGPSGSGLERPDSLVRLAEELGIVDAGALRAAGGPGRARRLVLRLDAGLRAVVQRELRPGRRRGPGVRHAGRGGRVGGLTTAVSDDQSGLLVADHDPASYAAAFERVLLEPGLRERLAAGALVHARQFGWDRTAAEMIEVYAKAQEKMRADLTGVAL